MGAQEEARVFVPVVGPVVGGGTGEELVVEHDSA